MKDSSRDEMLSLIGGERTLSFLWEQNNLLSAMLTKTERELAHARQECAKERARFEKLAAKQSAEFQRLQQCVTGELATALLRLSYERDELSDRVAELTAGANALRADSEYFRQRANQLQERVNSGGPVQAMADGAVEKAVDAYHSYLGKNKVGMIIALRKETGLGLVEAKSICLQIIAAIEAAKEATD